MESKFIMWMMMLQLFTNTCFFFYQVFQENRNKYLNIVLAISNLLCTIAMWILIVELPNFLIEKIK